MARLPTCSRAAGSAGFSDQGATTACSRELQFNFFIQCEISGFYFHSIACIGVILPREADGSGMLLVHPGCSLYAQAWHREKRPQEGEMALRPVLDFLFPRSRVIQSCPGEGTSASHAKSLLVVRTAALLSDLFCECLLNPLQEVKKEDRSSCLCSRCLGGEEATPVPLCL